jgi:hypothetical protein
MEVLTRALAAMALAALAGCSFLREPTPVEAMGEQPSVHALLLTGSDTVKVLLQRVGASRNPNLEAITAAPITGARVRLVAAGQEFPLAESPASIPGCVPRAQGDDSPATRAGCYAALLPGGVRPGAVYGLRIALAGGGTIEGETTALPALRLDGPAAGSRIRVAGRFAGPTGENTVIRVRTSGAEGAPTAAVELVPRVAYARGQAFTRFFCQVEYPRGAPLPRSAGGALEVTVYGIGCASLPGSNEPFRPDSVRATLRVVAFDSAYTRYLEAQESDAALAREVTRGVKGALGLFASAARAEHDVVLIPCPDAGSCAAP